MELTKEKYEIRRGRKPVEDKKVTVAIFPRMSRIEILGIEVLKEIAIRAIEKEYLKKAM